MISQWFSRIRQQGRRNNTRFQHSLVRNVVILMALASLLPILVIGISNMFRSRDLLHQTMVRQAERLVFHEMDQITEYIAVRNGVIDRLTGEEHFRSALAVLLSTPSGTEENQKARAEILDRFLDGEGDGVGNFFDQMFLLRPDNTIALATDDTWIVKRFGDIRIRDTFVRGMNGRDQSLFVFEEQPDGTSQMILFTSRSIADSAGKPLVTLIATAKSKPGDLTFRAVVEPAALLPGAKSYYFNSRANVIAADGSALRTIAENKEVRGSLLSIISSKKHIQARFEGVMETGQALVFAHWLPDYNIGVILAAPDAALQGPGSFTDGTNLPLLAICLALSGALILYGVIRFARPLVDFAKTADHYTRDNPSIRARVNRGDEIGMLAQSFNHMAEDLSALYHTLETVMDNRSSSLQTITEVNRQAAGAGADGMLREVVTLIAERFGFDHVGLYLYDETKGHLELKETSSDSAAWNALIGKRLEIDDHTLVGWVAANHQPRIVSSIQDDPLYQPNPLLPNTRSEAAVPVMLGDENLGVLDIHSLLQRAFDEETTAIFQALVNQVSTTLQTLRALESTQANYQETLLLYQIARQVAQAHTENEVEQALAAGLPQLPYLAAYLALEGASFNIRLLSDPAVQRVETGLQSIKIPAGRISGLLEEKRVIFIEDSNQPSEYDNLISFMLRRGANSAALLAVFKNGQLAGLLMLGGREAARVSAASLPGFAYLAEVIGASIEKFFVLATLQDHLSELQTLVSVSQAITAETDLHNLYRVLHRQVLDTLGADLEFAVAIYNAQQNLIEFPYFFENGEVISIPPTHLGEGLTSILIQNQQPLFLPTVESIQQLSPVHIGQPACSWMGIPLIFDSTPVGAVLFQDLKNEHRFHQEDLNLFMMLAPQIATAVRNTQLFTETQQALKAYDQERFLLNTLLDHIPEGISFKDTHGNYIRASESIARAYGLRAAEMIGKTDAEWLDAEAALRIDHEEQTVLEARQPEIGTIEHLTSLDGKEAWVHTSRIPIFTPSGEAYGLLVIQRDITDLKQAEALAQRRAEQVFTAAEIARDATGTLDMPALLQKSIHLVRERFGYYHASIFLIDAENEYAVLRESTGSAGQAMVESGHRLAVGSRSIVGQAATAGKPLIVNDVTQDLTHLPNPLLPDTRSEMAIPLKVGERILGILDVQSTQVEAFKMEDVSVLEILADQLAVAVVNGELFGKAQELLGKHRLLRQITIAASSSSNLEDALLNVVRGLQTVMPGDRIAVLMMAGDDLLQVNASTGFAGTRHLQAHVAPGQGIIGQAAVEKRPIRVDDALSDPRYVAIDPDVRSELAVPILFGEELLGVLDMESTRAAAFDENDQEIFGALGNNLGGVIANLRLVGQVRQQVLRERQLFEVTSKVRRSVDLGMILETSAQELARALGARKASIRIHAGPATLTVEEKRDGRNGSGDQKDQGAEGRKEWEEIP